MAAIAYIFNAVIQLYIFVLFATVILSWLISFNVVNLGNPLVDAISRTCHTLTEPVLRPIRNMLPAMSGLDLSPIIAFIGLNALQIFVNTYLFRPLIGSGL